MLIGAEPFTAAGREWRISDHFRRDRAEGRPEVTKARLVEVLENWVVRCVTVDRNGQEGLSHWGWVDIDGNRRIMQVVTPPSGEAIVETAYRNRKDQRELNRGNLQHFRNQCVRGNFEVR